MNESSDICNRLYALARERNGEDVLLELNGVPMLVLQRHESADHVLRRNAAMYRKDMAWLRQTLGASRFSEDDDAWQIRRDLTHAHLTHFDRERTCQLSRSHGDTALQRLIADSAQGAAIIDDRVLREMTVSVLVENFLGIAFRETGIDLDLIAGLMEYGSAYSFVPHGRTGTLYEQELKRLPGLRRTVLQQLRVFRGHALASNPVLAGMLAADADPGNNIVLEHELVAFLAAGAEASAATAGWACHLLATYPQVQDALRRQVLALDPDDGWAALADCTALADFASEALRMFPPSPITTRKASAADRIGDFDIAPGQTVMVSFIGIGHDARARPDPWVLSGLDPVRGPTGGTRMAFGIGPRICGGKLFAMTELMSTLATFLKGARFELTSSEAPRFHWKTQMQREGGHPVRVVPLAVPSTTAMPCSEDACDEIGR